jgi:hypothetical protein
MILRGHMRKHGLDERRGREKCYVGDLREKIPPRVRIEKSLPHGGSFK